MKPKKWITKHGTLTVTVTHVIDNNGGASIWTHEEFLARAGGVLHDLLRKTYGETVYNEAISLVRAFKSPDSLEDKMTDS
jgi:hypothetical protein